MLVKVVKGIVVRGRPADLLPDVAIRGAETQARGVVSGHAALLVPLPVDVVGGAGLGLAVAGMVRLLLGQRI